MIIGMEKHISQLAIIGPTASGKSDLAVTIAEKFNAIILSLDSLSIYKEIDIASAKPTRSERGGIPHLGIDLLRPNETFNVTLFANLYKQVYSQAQKEKKNLIIVGGTSFYLKVLIDGISKLPAIDMETAEKVKNAISNPEQSYSMLSRLDPDYMKTIALGDRYRIEKALEILYATGSVPSQYFKHHPPVSSVIGTLPIYRIVVEKNLLRDRISKRTAKMLNIGLIDEVASLEKKYSRMPNCMKAIGIKEVLDYLDGRIEKNVLAEKITINTARLAKRQTTFNRSQFEAHTALEKEKLEERIVKDLERD